MLVYIQQKKYTTKQNQNQQIFVNHNQNKQNTEPKIKKTQNPNMQYEPFRIFNLLPPFNNPQMPFP